MNRLTIGGFAGAVALAAALAGAAPAAATARIVPHNSTAACQTNPGCNEPVVAVSQTSGTDFVQADDAALTAQPGGQVYTRQNNALDNGSQDWSLVVIGHVPFFGSGQYAFTAFDRAHYAGRPIVQEQWTPFGQDVGLCANITRTRHLGITQACGTGGGQAFIVTRNVPGLNPPGAAGYVFLVSVRHTNSLARHGLLTASDTGFGQVTVARAVNHSAGVATDQMWSALP